MLAGDCYSKSWAMNNCRVVWAIGVSHIEPVLVAVRRTVSLVIKFPWESISAQPQKVLEVSDAVQICHPKGAVDGEVALDISYHCMDPQHPAWLHLHFHPSCAELRLGKQ